VNSEGIQSTLTYKEEIGRLLKNIEEAEGPIRPDDKIKWLKVEWKHAEWGQRMIASGHNYTTSQRMGHQD
jgi:hypothetical protein